MKQLFPLLLTLLLPFLSNAQVATPSIYDETHYVQAALDLGPENSDEPNTLWFRNTQDPTYLLKKVFADSSYSQVSAKFFYKDNFLEGPYYRYVNGVLSVQGSYKKGKLDGEHLSYSNQKLLLRSFYVAGLRSGTWEAYDLQGKLTRKTTFDNQGFVAAEETY